MSRTLTDPFTTAAGSPLVTVEQANHGLTLGSYVNVNTPVTVGGIPLYGLYPVETIPDALPEGVTVDADPVSGDVHAIHGPHFEGIQFHAESILTERGYDVLHELAARLLLD